MKQLFTESRGGTTLALGAPIGGPSCSERSTAGLTNKTAVTRFNHSPSGDDTGRIVCGRRPTAAVLRDPISPIPSFAEAPIPLWDSFVGLEALSRRASVPSRSVSEIGGSDDALDHLTFVILKMLRFSQAGHFNPSRLFRISSGFLSGNSLAAKGDTLIHGPHLVAQSVGSEWRTHRPYQGNIQIN